MSDQARVTAHPPAALDAQQAPVDIAFLGVPLDTPSATSWHRELRLLREAGRQVLVVPDAKDLPETLLAGLVIIADPAMALASFQIAAGAQILLRYAGAETPDHQRRLEERLGRRVLAAPLDMAERETWSRRLDGRCMTVKNWPPLVQSAQLHEVLRRSRPSPFRIGILDADTSGFGRVDLAHALGALEVPLDAFDIHHIAPTCVLLPEAPHMVISSAMPDVHFLSAALEACCPILVPDDIKRHALAPVLGCQWGALAPFVAELINSEQVWRQHCLDLATQTHKTRADRAFLDRFEEGTCGPAIAPGLRELAPRSLEPRGEGDIHADIALVGDFRRSDEVNLQAIAQIRAHASAGRDVLLVQTWNGRTKGAIHAGIDAAVRLGQARVLAPTERAVVDCAQILWPRVTIPALAVTRPAIVAKSWLVTETESAKPDWDVVRKHVDIFSLFGATPQWAASARSARAEISTRLGVGVETWPMAPPGGPRLVSGLSKTGRTAKTIGVVVFAPEDVEGILPHFDTSFAPKELRILMAGHRRSLGVRTPVGCTVMGLQGADIQAFVSRLDMLIVPPDIPFDRLPRLAIATALALGVSVVATPEMAPVLGAGPRFAPPETWRDIIDTPMDSPTSRDQARRRGSPALADAAFADIMGLAQPRAPKSASVAVTAAPRVMFVTANGVGLGHVTRLAAIARRLPQGVEPIFATMSQAAQVLKDMGFSCELLTSYAGKPAEAWRNALRMRMTDLLDQYRPKALVLDASNPYPGLLEAAACRPDLRLIWVRRGMWRANQDNSDFLSRGPYFDRIIEPQDIAESLEEGPRLGPADGAQAVDPRVVRVPPIGLLDANEILDRRVARLALGLPEMAPKDGSVLIQLGSGTTRDLNTLLSAVIARIRECGDLEIALAQWLNAPAAYDARWPGVTLLSGYPIARYYRAFDFTISAAGYNSFNDLMRFGVPTIFIANDAQCMDDQGARARFAQHSEAAFDIHENDLSALGDCVTAIRQPQVQRFLEENAMAISMPNGAKAAADTIKEIL